MIENDCIIELGELTLPSEVKIIAALTQLVIDPSLFSETRHHLLSGLTICISVKKKNCIKKTNCKYLSISILS